MDFALSTVGNGEIFSGKPPKLTRLPRDLPARTCKDWNWMKVQTKQEASSIGPDRKSFKRKTENIFLSINLKGCFGC